MIRCDDYSFFNVIFDDDKVESFWAKCLKRQEHLEMAYEKLGTLETGPEEFGKAKETLKNAGIDYYQWEKS